MKKLEKFEELKEKFASMSYVFTKSDYKQSYAAAKDIGGGWTDANARITKFRGLNEAEKWIENEIKWINMTDDEKAEQIDKEMAEQYSDC